MVKHILFVIRQPGSANAFIPLIEELRRQGTFSVTLLSYALSQSLLKEKGLDFVAIDSFKSAQDHLKLSTDFLITGTSENVADDELFWKWASENQIPSLAFVDQWSNLTQRFDCDNFPKHVAVLDVTVQQELDSFIGGRSQVHITGSPTFDVLRRYVGVPPLTKDHKSVLFALEPDIYGLSDNENRERHGFTEYDCLLSGARATCCYARLCTTEVRFILRPHPRDDAKRVQALIARLEHDVPQCNVYVFNGSKEQALVESDIVMGIHSMFLLEAAFVQRPVISIQLNRRSANVLTDGRANIKVAVTEPIIEQILAEIISEIPRHFVAEPVQAFRSIDRFIGILSNHL